MTTAGGARRIVSLVLVAGALVAFIVAEERPQRPTANPSPTPTPSAELSPSPSPTPSPRPSPNVPLFPPPIVETDGVYADRYAGFLLTIPDGWVEYTFSGVYHFAPSRSRLFAYRAPPEFTRATFTVAVHASQARPFGDVVAETKRAIRREHRDDGIVSDRKTRIAGRDAVIVEVRNIGDGVCRDCRELRYEIAWSGETVIDISVEAGSEAAFVRWEPDAAALLESLRPGPVDPFADDLRAFLDARVAGEGAERWLTRYAARFYRTYGLYRFGEAGAPDEMDITYFGVLSVEPVSVYATEFEVGVQGPRGGQIERIVMGEDPDDHERGVTVLDAGLLQAAGTS